MPRRKIDRSVPWTSSVIDMKTGMPVSPPPIPIICGRIRYFRELAGIEQKEHGKRICISPNTISNRETGRSRPDINLIHAICGALQVSLSEPFGIEDPKEGKYRRFRHQPQGGLRLRCQRRQHVAPVPQR